MSMNVLSRKFTIPCANYHPNVFNKIELFDILKLTGGQNEKDHHHISVSSISKRMRDSTKRISAKSSPTNAKFPNRQRKSVGQKMSDIPHAMPRQLRYSH